MMVLRALFVTLLSANFLLLNVIANYNYERISLYGHLNSPPGEGKSLFLDAQPVDDNAIVNTRQKREVIKEKSNVNIKIIQLKDRHKQLMVHWVGEGSNVIICLARDPVSSVSTALTVINPSAVYISYDYGENFENKTELFKLENGNYSSVEKFYNHPNYNTHFVFTDVINKHIFVTTNHGKNITRIPVDFTPSEVHFRELHSQTILILDKASSDRKLYHSTDFGQSFYIFEEHVKSFTWTNNKQDLILQRMLPSNLSSILYTKGLPRARYLIWLAKDVVDMFVKGDYIFYTKKSTSEDYDLFVSYKFKHAKKCIFDTELRRQAYQIVDITNDRALVSVSHTDMLSHLYVSESLDVKGDLIHFTLSLEYVLSYFPNTSWPDTWLHHVAEEPFTDMYKVEGLTGIYIASQVAHVPPPWNLGPQHLVTKITFDHGASWNYIQPPERDNEGQFISCDRANNCSLHLSQRFSQLYPDTRTLSILSSKSAPGILIGTGVIGKSFKGHFGVYISTDAGLTWKQTLKDLYFFNMGDHGGVLTAVKYFKVKGETRHILYSTNEGEKWNELSFHEEEIRLYGLMTEPGENTTIFTMFGSLPEEHQWIIVKIDLQKVFDSKCKPDDYKDWIPSSVINGKSTIPCNMGQQSVYKRRMPSVNCYNGENYDFPISVQSCECTAIDYECDFGFIRDETLGHCIRNKSSKNDPYAISEMCNPGDFYNRTKGYRKISGDNCVNDYLNNYESDVIPCPFNEIQTFLLIAQRDKIIRLDPFTKEKNVLPITDFKNVIAIDFDMRNNCVFWADIIKDHIGRQCLNGSTANEVLVNSNLSSVEGMAYDWISKNLYFVDGKNAKIELVRTDLSHNKHYFRKTVLSPPILKKPRGIAVHPTAQYLFWTDWADNPSINRSNLDGSDIKLLFTKPVVQWPNGITIDHIAERIYWVDAKEDYIGSSDLHGNKFKKILTNADYLSHPFSIAVFKDVMYWDDWKKNAIFSADKDHGIEIDILAEKMPGLMEMKIYAHSIQTGTNACSNFSCEYICVPVENKPVCLCPDVLELSPEGKCLCPGGIQPFTNMTCPQFQSTCSSKYFSCNNGQCIPKSWQCDNDRDCSNGEDESSCDTPTCGPLFFPCDDGTCLPEHLKCDYDLDCKDGSDERNCPVHNCTEGQFKCKNGRCISNRWVCDSDNDCRDWSDEQNCYPTEPITCKSSEFKCQTGGTKCISRSWVCDRDYDCKDRSDELNCSNITCSDFQFQCGGSEKKCIIKEWVCDGDNDCEDRSDETNCTTAVTPPPSNPYAPTMNTSCHDWMFTCGNKKCIPTWWKCDGAKDCEDGADEIGCNYPTSAPVSTTTEVPWREIHVCGPFSFQCLSGECIDASWVCDGSADCVDSDDELHCTKISRCDKDQFKCRKDGNCIHTDNVCNGKVDCPDGSDEVSCTHDHNIPDMPATASCANGFFPCDVINCYPLAMLCDGTTDCADGIDEKNCSGSTRYYQVLQMGVDDRIKNESSMLLYWWLPVPNGDKIEFLPSISEVDVGIWENKTWTPQSDYLFIQLKPFTRYNMTVYVRVIHSDKVFIPAKYYTDITGEGTPTVPTNITVTQQNGSHILISWGKPEQSNGVIQYYELCWYPPSPPIKLNLSDNTTAHLLSSDFQPDVTYNFYVVAYNGKYGSSMSEVKKLVFDGDVQIDIIRDLTVINCSDHSIILSWIYNKPYDGFIINVEGPEQYPKLPERNATKTGITITNLAPAVFYILKVKSYKKQFEGPESTISASTTGYPFPELTRLQLILHKESGTAVKLSWDLSKDSRKVDWIYGVYYGLTEEETLSKSRYNTTNLTAIISDLGACENYIFGVGIIGPLGVGPVELGPTSKTHFNKRAPPKGLSASIGPNGFTSMLVQWDASCPLADEAVGYIITVHERVKNITKTITFPNITQDQISRTFAVSQGGTYEITVSTDIVNAIPSEKLIYSPPPIPPPLEIQIVTENNGSYSVYWQEHKKPSVSVNYTFEVLVSEGRKINEYTTQIFEVDNPPFIYSNITEDIYSFAVQLRTQDGYKSILSEIVTVIRPIQFARRDDISKTSLTTVLVIVCMLLIILAGAFGLLYIRHRRLQNSFTRFTNSHYDTRADAATFEDNGLEEDDTPQIRGFSDDEPLVIA